MSENQTEPNFEATLRLFDDAVTALESDTLTLEDAVAQYAAAVKLASQCAEILNKAELRIQEIDQDIDALESGTS